MKHGLSAPKRTAPDFEASWDGITARAHAWHGFVSLTAAVGMLLVLWRTTDHTLPLLWFSLYLAYVGWNAWRTMRHGVFPHQDPGPDGQRRAAAQLPVAVGHALYWAALPPTLFPTLPEPYQQTVSWLILVLTVYASISVFSHPQVLKAYLTIVLLPLGASWIAWGGSSSQATFVLTVAVVWPLCFMVGSQLHESSLSGWMIAQEKHRLTEELAHKNRLLEAAHQSKNRILTTASHEVRQPVHALGLLVERLRVDPDAKLVRDQIDTIASVVRSLAHSLGLLLDISRLEAGSVQPSMRNFSIGPLLERLAAENQAAAAEKGLRLAFDACTWHVRSDPGLLHGILSNFVSNAIRYTERGSVSITARRDDKAMWIDVTDTGAGIPADMQQEIFREYVRLDLENQSVHGFGLGLAIVKRTADLLGLEVVVDSQVGHGSRFSVSVPLADAAADAADAGDTEEPAAAWQRSLAGTRGILIDNDPIVLTGMESMLSAWGCQVIVARSCQELESKLAHVQTRLDFIIADFHLGTNVPTGMDAIQLARRRLGRGLPAAVLTGDLNIRSIAPGDSAHIRVLHKPVLPSKLRGIIESMVHDRKADALLC